MPYRDNISNAKSNHESRLVEILKNFLYLSLFTEGSVLEVNVGGVEEHQEIDEAEDDIVLDAPADLK